MCNVGRSSAIGRSAWAWLMAIISRFAMGFVLAAYALLMLGAAIFLLPAGHEQVEVSAARYLGANTRMAGGLWLTRQNVVGPPHGA